MVLGNVMDVFLNVEVMTGELRKLRRAAGQVRSFGSTANAAGTRVQETFRNIGTRTQQLDRETGKLTTQYTGFRMEMLSVMFTGMALAGVFRRILTLMPGMSAASSALASALKVVLTPISKFLIPALINLATALMKLPKPVQLVIGVVSVLGFVFGTLLMVAGMFVMTLGAMFSGAMAAVAAVGAITMALATLAVGFTLGMKAVNKWADSSNIAFRFVGTVVSRVADAIVKTIYNFIDILKLVGVFISDVFAGRWAAAWDTLGRIASKVIDQVHQILRMFFITDLFDLLATAANKIVSAAKNIGESIIDGIIQGIKAAPQAILSVLDAMTPGIPIRSIIKAAGAVGRAAGGMFESVNDFVVTDSGRVLKTSPQDTIIGTKNPGALGGGGGGQVEVNINDPVMQDKVDVDTLVDEIEERIDRKTRGRSTL